MRRMEIQVEELTYDALRRHANRQGQSVAAAVRDLLNHHLPTGKQKPRRRNHDLGKLPPHTTPPKKVVRSIEELTFIGSASSGRPEDRVSERHDEILGEGRW